MNSNFVINLISNWIRNIDGVKIKTVQTYGTDDEIGNGCARINDFHLRQSEYTSVLNMLKLLFIFLETNWKKDKKKNNEIIILCRAAKKSFSFSTHFITLICWMHIWNSCVLILQNKHTCVSYSAVRGFIGAHSLVDDFLNKQQLMLLFNFRIKIVNFMLNECSGIHNSSAYW